MPITSTNRTFLRMDMASLLPLGTCPPALSLSYRPVESRNDRRAPASAARNSGRVSIAPTHVPSPAERRSRRASALPPCAATGTASTVSSPATVPSRSGSRASSRARATGDAAPALVRTTTITALQSTASTSRRTGLHRQRAAVAVDDVPPPAGARGAPHAQRHHVARQRRLRRADASRRQLPAQRLLRRHRPPREDLANRFAPRLRPRHQVTSVPTPRSVNSSATML